MRIVLQRVSEARVRVDGQVIGEIGPGALLLVGVSRNDTEADIAYLARKVAQLRVYNDEEGRLNAALDPDNGAFLVVSQFTLYADTRKGNRPAYLDAADPDKGSDYYEKFAEALRGCGFRVETGRFQANMDVELVNQGPVTILLESEGR